MTLIALDEIESSFRTRARDKGKSRWTDEEVVQAIQHVIAQWSERVGFYVDSIFVFQTVPTSALTLRAAVGTAIDEPWYVDGLSDGSVGHIKFGTEIVQFAGSIDGLLLNATRGGSDPHQINDPGMFMVYYDDNELLDVLFRQMKEILSMEFVSDGSPESTAAHQWQARFALLRADRFWRKYVSRRIYG
jgi:hypothetical protein